MKHTKADWVCDSSQAALAFLFLTPDKTMRFTVSLLAIILLSVAGFQPKSAESGSLPTYSQKIRVTGPLGKVPDGRPVNPQRMAVADLNGDGLEDVIISLWAGPLNQPGFALPILILLNNGAGGFVDGTADLISGPIPQTFVVRQFLIEDFNGDGRPDIFLVNHGLEAVKPFPGEQNRLLLSGPDGKLRDVTAENLPQVSDFSHGASAADIDGDGDIDLWINNLGGGNAPSYLMVNDGTGKFTIVADIGIPGCSTCAPPIVGTNGRLPQVMARSSGPFWAQFIDADNDGDPDLYVGLIENFNFSGTARTGILLNDGSGRFTLSSADAIPRPTFVGPSDIYKTQDSIVADINNDGLQDLLLYQSTALYVGHFIQILISNGDGTFRDETQLRLGAQPKALLGTGAPKFWFRDINGDGHNEILLKMFGPDFQPPTDITDSYLNLGNGFFTPLPDNVVDIRPGFVPVDVNGDRFVDFVDARFGFNSVGEAELFLTKAVRPPESVAGPLVAAVLPSSRSVRIGVPATVFATIISAGTSEATSCGISLIPAITATFTFQTTNPATNQVTGTPNTPVDIAAGAAQSFVFAITPTAAFAPIEVQLSFNCTNSTPAPIQSGLNTFLLSASATPVPDIVALAATLTNDGIVNVPGTAGTGAFAVATVNVGVSGSITASADTGSATLPVNISLCQTDPATGQCISTIGSNVTTTINANATPTFGIFVQGTGNLPFDPAVNRVFVRFKDSGSVTRGSTSVAVRTQ